MQESVFRGTWEIIKQRNFDKVLAMSCICQVGQLRKKNWRAWFSGSRWWVCRVSHLLFNQIYKGHLTSTLLSDMAESTSGQDEGNPVLLLATQAGKMNPSCRLLGIPHISPRRESCLYGYIVNPLLTKLIQSRWLWILSSFFFTFLWTKRKSRSIIFSHLDLTLDQ